MLVVNRSLVCGVSVKCRRQCRPPLGNQYQREPKYSPNRASGSKRGSREAAGVIASYGSRERRPGGGSRGVIVTRPLNRGHVRYGMKAMLSQRHFTKPLAAR